MNDISFKTFFKFKQQKKHKWYIINAKNKKLGRISTIASYYLLGKNSPYYSPNFIINNHVIIINVNKIIILNKNKKYITYSGYQGGQKVKYLKNIFKIDPIKIIKHSIIGMLPKNKLSKKIKNNLHVFLKNNNNIKKKFLYILK